MRVSMVVSNIQQISGITRYAKHLHAELLRMGLAVDLCEPEPEVPIILKRGAAAVGYDLNTFFRSYPLGMKRESGTVLHLTSQSLATILTFRTQHPVIITVHDILPYMLRNDPSLSHYKHRVEQYMDLLAMRCLSRADILIADSFYTKQTLIDVLHLPSDRIQVVHLGVDHETFRPVEGITSFLERYQLSADQRYVLYVGSEAPRKNFKRVVDAFGRIADEFPNLKLVKVGSPQFSHAREQVVGQIESLGLSSRVVFTEGVSEGDLALFYNKAELFIFPSLYEGFGFPVLEAMACGTPVICSNTASLPELVGDAALLVDPYDVDGVAAAMRRVLSETTLSEYLRNAGLKQAHRFTWADTAQNMARVYFPLMSVKNV